MLKFAIIGPATANTKDLSEAVQLAGHHATVLKFSEIIFEIVGDVFVATRGGVDICDFDVVIFRGYDRHIEEAQLLAEMLVEKNVTIIEQTLAGCYVSGKIQQAKRLFQGGIKHPKTFQANNIEGWGNVLKELSFPILAKPILGCKGRGIQKLVTLEEAQDFFSLSRPDYLVQQYFPIVSDFRVFVVCGKVVGSFKRFINEGQYKSNIRGTRAEKIEIGEEMEKISIKATAAMGYEVAGVDLFEHDGDIYVIEVNVTPQWEKFKLVTGINPAKHIIEYAIEKRSKK